MRWLSLLALVGCVDHTSPSIEAFVTRAAGAPLSEATVGGGGQSLAGVTVAVACKVLGTAGKTDADGFVHVELYSDAERSCTITASLPGYAPLRLEGIAPCAPHATCDPLELSLVHE